MNLTNFDKILWRFVGLVLALACVGIVAFIGIPAVFWFGTSLQSRPVSKRSAAPNRKIEEHFHLGGFSRIQGTPFLAASLNKNSSSSFGSSLSSYSYSGSYSGSTYGSRNYLFFDSRSGKSRWLAKNNDSIYTQHELFADPSLKPDERKIGNLIYEVATDQSKEKNSRLDDMDKSIIFYNPEEASQKTIVENIDQFLGIQQMDKEQAIIFFCKDGKNRALYIKTSSGIPVAEKEIAEIPAETPPAKSSDE